MTGGTGPNRNFNIQPALWPNVPKTRNPVPPTHKLGDRIRGTLGDIDPLNKVPVKESQKRVKKGFPFKGPPHPT